MPSISPPCLEYSISLLIGSENDKKRCLLQIESLIARQEDDVRCYALPARGFAGPHRPRQPA